VPGGPFDLNSLLAVKAPTLSPNAFRRQLRVGNAQWRSYALHGLSAETADRLATRIGLHPGEVWGDWFDEGEQ
jgi:hypothetical protein